MTLSLRIFPSVLLTTNGAPTDITGDIQGWRRSIKSNGGFWMGDFTLVGPEQDLAKIFYERLGGHLEERWNGYLTWEGMIYEMDLTYRARRGSTQLLTRRRSLDLMYNYVYGNWVDPSGNQGTLTPVSSAASIGKYGRREENLQLSGVKQAAAEARRDTYLKEKTWPWPRVVSVTPRTEEGEALLEVQVCGYALTANWRYATVQDGLDGPVSTYINNLITTDCPFLTPQKIDSNSLSIVRKTLMPTRTGDLLFLLTNLGDANGDPWRLHVVAGRKVVYEKIDITPKYYLRGGNLYSTAGGSVKIDAWMMQPSVLRDLTYPVSLNEYGGFLPDARDFYVSEIEVGTGNGLVLKTELFEESEILAAQAEYDMQRFQDELGETGGGGGDSGKSKGRLNWKRKWKLPEDQWKDYQPGSPGFWKKKQKWIAEQKAKKKAKKGKTGKKKRRKD